MTKTIAFSHPRRGLEGTFATFRLGSKWAEKLTQGDTVELIDARTKRPLKTAKVVSVTTGELAAMASTFGRWAHNWQEHPVADRPQLLLESIRRRFKHWGPNRTADSAPCSVIFLKEVTDESL
ncbi:hypothetical protein GFK26_18030 [Variovorax paradoxus]|uniref:ASCH domain-containing protein n=1 Tax=Variovorax paradoxus TaxID=34073 RepID=A0A5Q0M5R9_VARPD|nr:hypothetical protein [Variovorax paradoxus]QFZ84528.1 hypothetical protein GFK26_18030 [Variovorax paradoxus]